MRDASLNVERRYYEDYWQPGVVAPPEQDPLTEERAKLFFQSTRGTGSVLDLGCGSGRAIAKLTGQAGSVVGLDISRAALLQAKVHCPGSSYLQAACDAPLPFSSACFDAVYCAEVIEHVLDPRAMVSECHRILRPGGTFFVTTPYHGLLKNLAVALVGFDKHFDVRGPHIRFFTRKSLCGLLVERGFVIQKVWCLGRYWPVWMNMAVCALKT